MTESVRGVWPLLAAGLFACASVSPAPEPRQGPTWLRLESEHFVLYTDQREQTARDTILSFERLLAAYEQLGSLPGGELTLKKDVAVLDRMAEYVTYSNDPRGFQLRAAAFEPMIVMPNGPSDQWAILKHELTHALAYHSLPDQPAWFAEGLAVYFQTARFDDDSHLVVGEAPGDLREVLESAGSQPASKLLSAESPELRSQFYASAWLLVHYLMSQHPDGFARLRDGFARGLSRDAAWAEAFPELSVDQLDQELASYLASGDFASRIHPVQPYAGAAPRVTALSRADLHALRGRLLLSCPSCGSEQFIDSTENVEQALRRDPKHLDATLLRIPRLPAEERMNATHALIQAHPEAWQAWTLLALAEQSEPSRGGHCSPLTRKRLATFGANSAYAEMLSAVCQAAEGKNQEAVATSEQAARRQPADSELLMMQASVLLQLHECDALHQLLPRLRSASHPQVATNLMTAFEACRESAQRRSHVQ